MVKSDPSKGKIDSIIVRDKEFAFVEQVHYPNGGYTRFYRYSDEVLAVDHDICKCERREDSFPYSLITDKQNYYMKQSKRLYRILSEDLASFTVDNDPETVASRSNLTDRADVAEASPLEFLFERKFTDVYGLEALECLDKEYCIMDSQGQQFFLDYVVNTTKGKIAVEENGITYHHPQIIGYDGYRRQLQKQNACALNDIKLYRFSTEDCSFEDRIADDIRSFFGDEDTFFKKHILLTRKTELYEHQKDTLVDIQTKRQEGVKSFLVVFPTASGKSRIVEEDIRLFAEDHQEFRALILAPNDNIIDDWKARIGNSLNEYEDRIQIHTYAYMIRHYMEFPQDYYSYIVIDEAHHAVAPAYKRMIWYFTPVFMIGLTATDQRPDKKKLETVFGNYETNLTLLQAMETGIVAKANVYRIETNLDLSKIRFNGQDYVNADLEKSIRVTSRNELIADVLQKYFCEGSNAQRQGIIFCVNTQHTKEMERILLARGISARAYTSKERNPEKIMADFKNHKIRFLCACNMISEGWDYPELGILVMARPTISKVLYLQQIGRGLRKTDSKKNVFVIDVVDEYGAMAKACSMHSIFQNSIYVPFGDITKREYHIGDVVEVDGLYERVERIMPVDIETFEDKYGDYLNQEQLAREFYMSTGSITSWIQKGKITPSVEIPFGSRKIYLFSPDNVTQIKERYQIAEHNDDTIKDDFFNFLKERDYSLSYKMPFMLALLKNMDQIGDASISNVLDDYIDFYQARIDKGLPVDRKTCPYNETTLKDKNSIRQNMLTNPFEKFERKRFLYYSKNLGMISMNHALFSKMTEVDFERVKEQMVADLKNYYEKLEG